MGNSNRKRRTRFSCGHLGYKRTKTSELCPKCSRRDSPASSSKHKRNKKKKSVLGGEMDSKHFSSRSTTDNLPSSLSTPGERAGLASASPTTVDTSVATSSTNTSSMSPHLSSTCATSAQTEITSHATNTATAALEAETDTTRLPPDATDSPSVHSDTSDKTYDPKNDPNFCSSSNSSLSDLSAVISSTKVQTDDLLDTELKANGLSSTDGVSLSPPSKNSISLSSNNGQNVIVDTANAIGTGSVSGTSNKDNTSSISERLEDGCKDNVSSSPNKKYLPATDLLPSGSNILNDAKPSIADASPQSTTPRGTKRTHGEIESTSEESSNSPKPSPQKNKKRCYICSCKLELAQRTIGKCRCDHVFCPTHRLPELHDCVFNHKEDGRREAREKMVKPTRHMGTSFRRDDQT